jgi:hypothetical protein
MRVAEKRGGGTPRISAAYHILEYAGFEFSTKEG